MKTSKNYLHILTFFATAICTFAEQDPVDAFFNRSDPFVHETVIPNIHKYRTGTGSVKVVDPTGRLIPNARIHLELRHHQFHFGCLLPPEWLDDPKRLALWESLWSYTVPDPSPGIPTPKDQAKVNGNPKGKAKVRKEG